jgi:DNA polymerase I-like protein with 3'-5' exonuclease and polymerase domains
MPRCLACSDCGALLIDGKPHKVSCKKPDQAEPEAQIRDIYIAPPGYKYIYFDLSQAELRGAANFSGDETFIASCEKDIHTSNAKILFPDAATVLDEDPKGKGKKFRDIAKNCSFAVSYLAEASTVFAYLVGKGFKVTLEIVETMLGRLKNAYWRYYEWVAANIRFCQRHGYLRTPILGRRQILGWHPKPTEVANYPIQGGIADIMSLRIPRILSNVPKGCFPVIYQYDALVLEVPDAKVENAKKAISEVWRSPIEVPYRAAYVQPIDLKVGVRLSDFG